MKIFLLPLVAAFICLAASYHQNAAATGPAQTSNVCASNPAPATLRPQATLSPVLSALRGVFSRSRPPSGSLSSVLVAIIRLQGLRVTPLSTLRQCPLMGPCSHHLTRRSHSQCQRIRRPVFGYMRLPGAETSLASSRFL